MAILKKIIIVVLILLGISGGIVKIMQMPQEMEFFRNVGFTDTGIILFGIAHLIGGILLIFQKTRLWGALIIANSFSISTVLIFIDGKIAFGFISTLSVLMAVYITIDSAKTIYNKSPNQIGANDAPPG